MKQYRILLGKLSLKLHDETDEAAEEEIRLRK